MGILGAAGISQVYHFLPLHYLPYVARDQRLYSKEELERVGFDALHFRSTSRRQDCARGFGNAVHMTSSEFPDLLSAKLEAGFPHLGLSVPAEDIEAIRFDLCRYNIAKMRAPRKAGRDGALESDTNGRYYANYQVPVAREAKDQRAMLRKHFPRQMIEILLEGMLALPPSTRIIAYSVADAETASDVLAVSGTRWRVIIRQAPAYLSKAQHIEAVRRHLVQSMSDLTWRGNGLEFDNFRTSEGGE